MNFARIFLSLGKGKENVEYWTYVTVSWWLRLQACMQRQFSTSSFFIVVPFYICRNRGRELLAPAHWLHCSRGTEPSLSLQSKGSEFRHLSSLISHPVKQIPENISPRSSLEPHDWKESCMRSEKWLRHDWVEVELGRAGKSWTQSLQKLGYQEGWGQGGYLSGDLWVLIFIAGLLVCLHSYIPISDVPEYMIIWIYYIYDNE